MFGIGGGELIFILFIVLMLFGADKVPEIARTMGKAMAQLKNATNDIKNEIQKGAEANGYDPNMLSDFTQNITSEINTAKTNLIGDTNPLTTMSNSVSTEIEKVKYNITHEDATPESETPNHTITVTDNVTEVTIPETEKVEEPEGPIKRNR